MFNAHQMANIIIVAPWTGADFWQRWFHVSYYVAVKEENCNHLGPDWHGPPTVKDIVLSDIRFFFWITSRLDPNLWGFGPFRA